MRRFGVVLGAVPLLLVAACESVTYTDPGLVPQFAKPASNECMVDYRLLLDEMNRVRADIADSAYVDRVDKVSVGTGSGDGMRFDTIGVTSRVDSSSADEISASPRFEQSRPDFITLASTDDGAASHSLRARSI